MRRSNPTASFCSISAPDLKNPPTTRYMRSRPRFPARTAAEQDIGAASAIAIFGDVAVNLMHRSQERFGAASDTLFELPLVSVVVVNYNYGHLLRQAVTSILNQTYPKVECIIVDNASTDDSEAVLHALDAAHAGLKIIRRSANHGQTAASLDGFAVS